MRRLFHGLGVIIGTKHVKEVLKDIKGAMKVSHNEFISSRTKHIAVRYYCTCQVLKERFVEF